MTFDEFVIIFSMGKELDAYKLNSISKEKCLRRIAELFDRLTLTDKKLHNCDTCKYFKDKEWGMCCTVENDDYGLTQWYVKLIKRVGCMSYKHKEE